MGNSNVASPGAKNISDLLLENIRKNKEEQEKAFREKCRAIDEETNREMTAARIQEIRSSGSKKQAAYNEFSTSVKEKLMLESIYHLYNKALGGIGGEGVKRNYVHAFIKENGIDRLMNQFSKKTEFLCDMTSNIKDYHKKIMEAVDKDDEGTFHIDTAIQDDFYKSLETDSAEEMADAIKSKVASSINDFILANQDDNQKTLDAMSSLSQDGEGDEVDAVMGETGILFGRDTRAVKTINAIKNRKQTIFETMVWSISEAAHKKETIKEAFTVNGKLDMSSIIEASEIMYTFLETISTTKMINLDAAYIEKVYKELKS